MKKFWLIALIVVSLALAGCGSNGGETSSNTKTFVGGTNGVVMSFEQSAPPAEVIKGEGFDVVVILTNKGEWTIPDKTYSVKLKGFSPVDFGTDKDALEIVGEELPAADINPDTGETIDPYDVYLTVPELGLNYVGGVSGNMEYPMTVEICYPYRTDAYGNICVKEKLQDSTDTDTCTISGPKDITSSGAPVQIRNLEEYSGGSSKIRFSFEIFDANANSRISKIAQGCLDDYADENYVYINIDTGLNDGLLSCNGLSENTGRADGSVKLNSGVRKITCSQEISDNEKGDYIKTIAIYATYDVKQSMSTTILIKNVE